MKQYYSYAICTECDNVTFYPKDCNKDEIPSRCQKCGNDNLEYITDDDVVVEEPEVKQEEYDRGEWYNGAFYHSSSIDYIKNK